VSTVDLQAPTPVTPGTLTATLALARGARYRARDHRVGLLLVDASGQPLGLDYATQSTVTDGRGNVSRVSMTLPAGTAVPAKARLYVIADVFPLYSRQLS
jgi:hypothetical protein